MTRTQLRKLLEAVGKFLGQEVHVNLNTEERTEYHFYVTGRSDPFMYVVDDQVHLTSRTLFVPTSPYDGQPVYVGTSDSLMSYLVQHNFVGYYQIKPADNDCHSYEDVENPFSQRHTRAVTAQVLQQEPLVRELAHQDVWGFSFVLEVDGVGSMWTPYDSFALVKDKSGEFDWLLTQEAWAGALPRLAKIETIVAFPVGK